MEKQCLKCNSVAKDDAAACAACGAPFGPIPPPASARRMLLMITLVLLLALAGVLIWMQTR
jgi:hypothetical protein